MSIDCQIVVSAVNEAGVNFIQKIIPEKEVEPFNEAEKPEDGDLVYSYTLDLTPMIDSINAFLSKTDKINRITEYILEHPDAVDTLPSLDKIMNGLEAGISFLEKNVDMVRAARQAVYRCRSVKQLMLLMESQVEDWRTLSMEALEIPGKLLHKLTHHRLTTLGGLAEYCGSGRTVLSLEFISPDDERALALALRDFLRRRRSA